MKRQLTVLMILLSINLTVFTQHNFGLKINGGFSKISNSFAASYPDWTIQFAPSGHCGLFYNLDLSDKSVIGAELLFTQIEGKEKLTIDFFDNKGNNVGYSTAKIYKHISYLSLPIYYGFKLKKLMINVGFQVSYVLTSSSRDKGQTTNNLGVTNWDNKLDDLNVPNYDFGPRAGVTFNLTDKLEIEGEYYYGVNNIMSYNVLKSYDGKPAWRVQQTTIGLKYTFYTTKKEVVRTK